MISQWFDNYCHYDFGNCPNQSVVCQLKVTPQLLNLKKFSLTLS